MKLFSSRLAVLTALATGAAVFLAAPRAQAVLDDATPPGGAANPKAPTQLKGVKLDEKQGAKVPLGTFFQDEHGKPIKLGSLFTGGKPVILTFNYSDCPMLCSVELGALVDTMRKMTWTAGVEFRVVTIIINPMEKASRAAKTKASYLSRLKKPQAEQGWRFLTGSNSAIHAVTDAVGFNFHINPDNGQFLHPAAITMVTPDGTVSSYLYGVAYDPKVMTNALRAARDGKVLDTQQKFLLACFHYTPPRGNARAAVHLMSLAGGVFLVVFLGAFGTALWLRGRRRRRTHLGT